MRPMSSQGAGTFQQVFLLHVCFSDLTPSTSKGFVCIAQAGDGSSQQNTARAAALFVHVDAACPELTRKFNVSWR